MVSFESINYSIRNLKHKKGRSFLTLFSILIGIATIFIFVSFGYGLYKYTEDLTSSSSANKILIMSKGGMMGMGGGDFVLNDDDVEAIERATGVNKVSGFKMKTAEVKDGNKIATYTNMISYDPRDYFVLESFDITIDKGRMLEKGDKKAVVLGANYRIDGKILDEGIDVNDVIEINGIKMKAVGFVSSMGNPSDDAQIYMSQDYFDEIYPNESYIQIVAEVDTKNIEQVVDNVERALRKERNLEKGKEDFTVQSFDDLIESFSMVLNIIVGFVILIALISVLVSAINTANTMITSVLERYREIGVLKAIGATNGEIFFIFLFESALLGFIAGVLGVLVGWFASSVAGNILMNLGWGFLQPYYDVYLFGGCILFAVLTGAISGVLPAMRASKINIVNALRYE
jgi:putative ABC transport system permease protein